MTTATRYRCQHVTGATADHVRLDGPGGKTMWWERDGRRGLGGLALADMLPWGSRGVVVLGVDTPVVVTEGERAAAALHRVDIAAVATFGAEVIPSVAALGPIAPGRRFVLWPDEDPAGRRHMAMVGDQLYRAGARTVFVVDYRPTAWDGWPEHHDAADFLAPFATAPELGGAAVALLIDQWVARWPRPIAERPLARRSGFDDDGSVTAALTAAFGITTRPGRSIRCPQHDDRHASLSVLADDRRAICHAPSCRWSSPGVTARDIAR